MLERDVASDECLSSNIGWTGGLIKKGEAEVTGKLIQNFLNVFQRNLRKLNHNH